MTLIAVSHIEQKQRGNVIMYDPSEEGRDSKHCIKLFFFFHKLFSFQFFFSSLVECTFFFMQIYSVIQWLQACHLSQVLLLFFLPANGHLSFSSEDTRNTATDFLNYAFEQNGIYTFKDDQKLEKGKTIEPELFKTIKESRFAVVIL